MRRAAAAACTAVLLAVISGSSAVAHTGGSTGYASVTVERSTVRYMLTLPTAALPSGMAEDLRLTQTGSAQARDRLLDVVRRAITLSADGTRCAPGPGHVQPGSPETPNFTLLVDFACPSGFRELAIRDDIFDVLGTDHHTLTKVEWPGGTGQLALEPASREGRFAVSSGASPNLGSFVVLGVHHILSGYDHLLFLVALLLSGGSLLSLVKIVTAFTLAHSVTLTLAVLEVIVLPDRLVEAVIALSIAFVAAENLAPRPAITRRWLVSFAFGLVHGFGFSSALRELGLGRQGLILSLFGFNIGVEIGQALVITALLPLLVLLRRTRWKARAVVGSSLAILAVGVILFVERAFL